MLQNLSWFLGAFSATLGALAIMRYRLSLYERHLDLKNTLQAVSQEVALGYFQHCYNKLNELTVNATYKDHIDVLKAQCLLGLGRKEELLEFLNRTVDHYPKNHTARRMLAKLLVETGSARQAIEHFNMLKGRLSDEDLLPRAIALYQVEEYAQCQNLIQEECAQPNGQVLALLADALFAQSQWALAIDYYKKAENLGWKPLSQIARKGQAYLHLQKYEDAEPCFREWLRANPQDSEAALGLSCCLQRQGNYTAALQILQAFEQDLLEDPFANDACGRCYFGLKDYPKATHYLLNAYEIGLSDPNTLALAAISLEKQHQWLHAEKLYQCIVQEHKEHFIGHAGLAYLFATGQAKELCPQSGLDHALKTVELHPCLSSWEILSAAYARCGMFEKAHQIQENLIKYASDEQAVSQRQDAMRRLRQHKPLGPQFISRVEVA